MEINTLRPQESIFLRRLELIALKPEILYCLGDVNKIDKNLNKVVAIVGSRKPTTIGRERAYKIAYELAKRGVVIVSGLAFGVDIAAHKGALDAGGTTVAVLGTPIDQIQPSAHEHIAREIIKGGGLIISEYFPGEKVFTKTSFLYRNRIISGLSDSVVVVEATRKSGSINTATHGLNQGKDVRTIPGDIDNLLYEGCNRLIFQGANPIVSIRDFIEEVAPTKHKKGYTKKGDNAIENKILNLIENGIRDGDEIVNNLGIDVSEFNVIMTMMEIRGLVKSLSYNQWLSE